MNDGKFFSEKRDIPFDHPKDKATAEFNAYRFDNPDGSFIVYERILRVGHYGGYSETWYPNVVAQANKPRLTVCYYEYDDARSLREAIRQADEWYNFCASRLSEPSAADLAELEAKPA